MNETILVFISIGLGIALIALVAKRLDHQAKTKGPLFSRPATPASRIFAFLLGILFAGVLFIEYLNNSSYSLEFSLLSVLCFLYSFGATDFLIELQKEKHPLFSLKRSNEKIETDNRNKLQGPK